MRFVPQRILSCWI